MLAATSLGRSGYGSRYSLPGHLRRRAMDSCSRARDRVAHRPESAMPGGVPVAALGWRQARHRCRLRPGRPRRRALGGALHPSLGPLRVLGGIRTEPQPPRAASVSCVAAASTVRTGLASTKYRGLEMGYRYEQRIWPEFRGRGLVNLYCVWTERSGRSSSIARLFHRERNRLFLRQE